MGQRIRTSFPIHPHSNLIQSIHKRGNEVWMGKDSDRCGDRTGSGPRAEGRMNDFEMALAPCKSLTKAKSCLLGIKKLRLSRGFFLAL